MCRTTQRTLIVLATVAILIEKSVSAVTTKSKEPKARPMKPKLSRARRLLRAALVLHLTGTLAAVISIFLAETTRPTFMLLYAPRHPFLALSMIGVVIAYVFNKKTLPPRVSPRTHPWLFWRKWHLAILEAIAVVVSLFYLMGFHVGIPRSLSDKSIRVLTYNVFFNRLDKEGLCKEIEEVNADITVLQAAHQRFENTLRPRFPEHTIRQDGEFIIMTKATVKVLKVEVPNDLPDDLLAMYVRYELETPAGVLNLYSVHPFSARHALFMDKDVTREEDSRRREVQIINFTEKAEESRLPTVIAGDWNVPEGSGIERRRLSGFTDAFASVGVGFGYTFPSKRPWMRIDRVLTPNPAKIRFGRVAIGPHANSDHRSLTVDFDIVN